MRGLIAQEERELFFIYAVGGEALILEAYGSPAEPVGLGMMVVPEATPN